MIKVELIRTNEVMTAGITNIPLTKPAIIYFKYDLDDNDNINACYLMLESLHIEFNRTDNHYNGKVTIQSKEEIPSNIIKMIFRNFRTLRPKLITNWRYLFWEIDSKDMDLVSEVLAIYNYLGLPVYVHNSARGYHFLSIKPIEKTAFQFAIEQLRRLGTLETLSPALQVFYENDKYPPITLRIKANKYVNEQLIFNEGWIVSNKFHSDTKQLRDWIVNQEFEKIGQQYQLVWYEINSKQKIQGIDV